MRSHAELCMELQHSHRELALLEAQILRDRRAAWENSQETTVTARNAYVQHATAEIEADVILLKGEIRALEYELRAVEWSGSGKRD